MRRPDLLEQYATAIGNHQDLKMDVNPCRRYTSNKMTQASRFETFSCRNPRVPQMSKFQHRFLTYENWPNLIKATPTEMAEAGFIYLNQSDKVKCFYCNGGLQHWKYNENPWFEHAKWYPNCEYLLRCQGMEYVQEISSLFPNLQRPSIENLPSPSRNYDSGSSSSSSSRHPPAINPLREVMSRHPPAINPLREVISDWKYSLTRSKPSLGANAMLKEAMTKDIVKEALQFGFGEDLIEKVVERKLKYHISEYETVESLIDDLIKEEKEEDKEEEGSLVSPVEEATSMETGSSELTYSVYSMGSSHTQPKNIATLSSQMNVISLEDQSKRSPEISMDIPHSSDSSSILTRISREEVDQRIRSVINERTCKICLDREIDCILIPCNHMCCCAGCAAAVNKCPICRARLDKVIKVYRQ